MENNLYIVYIKTDLNGYITDVNSSAFLTDTLGWIEIGSGYGDKYHHAQGNYFEKPIVTMSGAYQYKMVNNEIIECAENEIIAQEETNKKIEEPTWQDKIEAQVTYNSMMLGTLIEEV